MAPQDSPSPKGIPQPGRQFNGGPLEVVDQDPAQGVGVPAAQRLQDLRVHGGGLLGGHSLGQAEPVQASGRPPGVDSP